MLDRIKKVLLIFIGLLVFSYLYLLINKKTGFYIPCIFNKITGLRCPGCGITRCIFSLMQFKFKDAFFYNQFVFIFFPFWVLGVIYEVYCYIVSKDPVLIKNIPKWIWNVLIIILIVFCIARNIYSF